MGKVEVTADDRLKALHEAIADAVAEYKGLGKPTKQVKQKQDGSNYMVAIPIGDPHIGMYAWSEEAGEDFDTDIARTDLLNASRSCSMRHLTQTGA